MQYPSAKVLPLLVGSDPMAAWTNHLGKEEAVASPRCRLLDFQPTRLSGCVAVCVLASCVWA